MSDEPSGSGSGPSALPPPPAVRPSDRNEEAADRRAVARAVGVDTAFLDALGDDFKDAPSPVGRYARGGTLVVEGSSARPKPPTTSAARTRERDAVLAPEFFEETTPTLQLEGVPMGEGPILFETAAVASSRVRTLNLPSGRFPGVGHAGDMLPDVLAQFDSGPDQMDEPDNEDMVVSVKRDASSPDEDAEPESKQAATEDSEVAQADLPSPPDAEDQPDEGAESKAAQTQEAPQKRTAAGTEIAVKVSAGGTEGGGARQVSGDRERRATTVAAPPPRQGRDPKTLGLAAVVALALVVAGVALTREGETTTDDAQIKHAAASQAGQPSDDQANTTPPNANSRGESLSANGGGGDRATANGGGDGGKAPSEDPANNDPAGDPAGDAAAANADTGADPAIAEGVADDTEGAADVGGAEGGATLDETGNETADAGNNDRSGGGPSPITLGGTKSVDRAAEDDMTPKELRQAARKAIGERRYGDAYRLAGKAQRAQPGEQALVLRVEAACGLKNKANAKQAFGLIQTGRRRRDLRARCRDLGLRLGL